jgi:hypothetical protein
MVIKRLLGSSFQGSYATALEAGQYLGDLMMDLWALHNIRMISCDHFRVDFPKYLKATGTQS